MRIVLGLAACALLFSCDGGGSGQPDAGNEAAADAGWVIAQHSPLPIATSKGGPVLAQPKLVAISFQSDANQSAVDAFASQLQANPEYWSGATSEYGVGPITTTTYHAAETPPATLTDGDVETWITNKIQTDTTFPQNDVNTMYMMFYPSGTTVSFGGDVTCGAFQGYHSSFPLGAGYVTYGVVPRCPPPQVMGVTIIDQMTAEASHEVVEAATDPVVQTTPGYLTVDANSHAWELLAGGEIGDLCAAFPDSFYKPAGFTTLMQRVWSNAAGAASHDPCEPDGTSPYFNSAPLFTDMITVDVGGVHYITQGVKLAVGQSETVELDLYSDGPTSGPWTVTALDLSSAFFGGPTALAFTFDNNTGQNGDKLNLTIKSLKAVTGGALFWIQSDLGGAGCNSPNKATGTLDPCSIWLGAVNAN